MVFSSLISIPSKLCLYVCVCVSVFAPFTRTKNDEVYLHTLTHNRKRAHTNTHSSLSNIQSIYANHTFEILFFFRNGKLKIKRKKWIQRKRIKFQILFAYNQFTFSLEFDLISSTKTFIRIVCRRLANIFLLVSLGDFWKKKIPSLQYNLWFYVHTHNERGRRREKEKIYSFAYFVVATATLSLSSVLNFVLLSLSLRPFDFTRICRNRHVVLSWEKDVFFSFRKEKSGCVMR